MAKLMMEFTGDEVYMRIPYSLICMTRYGVRWNTMHRKRRWKEEFSEAERQASKRIFSQSHNWTLGRGVPEKVCMYYTTYQLWQKLGAFCASI